MIFYLSHLLFAMGLVSSFTPLDTIRSLIFGLVLFMKGSEMSF